MNFMDIETGFSFLYDVVKRNNSQFKQEKYYDIYEPSPIEIGNLEMRFWITTLKESTLEFNYFNDDRQLKMQLRGFFSHKIRKFIAWMMFIRKGEKLLRTINDRKKIEIFCKKIMFNGIDFNKFLELYKLSLI